MKNKTISFLIIFLFIFVFAIFYKGLNKSNLYTPSSKIRNIPEFNAKTLFEKKTINSKDFFDQNKFYLFNIWASWCVPCIEEHHLVMILIIIDEL